MTSLYVVTADCTMPWTQASAGAHALCIITEWDEFAHLDYERIYASMSKPAFVFDGRNVLDLGRLQSIGFITYGMGKPIDPFLRPQQ